MKKKGAFLLIIFVLYTSNNFCQLAQGHDKFIGNATDPPIPSNYDIYWNQITPGNAGKWGSVESSRDIYTWTSMDQIYNYALERGIPAKLHILVQGNQQPGWVSQLDSADQAEEVEEWIRLAGERYPELSLVDVVGEPIHSPAPYKTGLGGDGVTGWDWVIKTFQLARQYMPPKAKLILHESGILNGGPDIGKFIEIINLLKERNLIDGIGLVGHNTENIDTTVLKNVLDQFAATGIGIYISSLDIGSADDQQQLEFFKEKFPVLWKHPGIRGITFWGYIQGQTFQANGYLVRTDGSERPAMQWLREFLTLSGTFRSIESGSWNNVNTWERYNGTEWVHPASDIPSGDTQGVIIRSDHTINVTASDSASKIFIEPGATLTINPGTQFKVKNNDKTDFTISGTLNNSGIISKDDSAEVRFSKGSRYIHNQDGGSIPSSTWLEGSVCELTGLTGNPPGNVNQNFYDIILNNESLSASITLGWSGNIIEGNISVLSTGTGRISFANAPAELTIEGDIILSGGKLNATASNTQGSVVTINHNGNINITGGELSLSSGTSAAVWKLGGNFSMSGASADNSEHVISRYLFSRSGTQSLNLGSGNTITALPLEVSSGSTLNINSNALTGSGIFKLNDGSTLQTSAPGGINDNVKTTGLIQLSKNANYIYNGTSAQVTGTLLPDTINGLMINNSEGVTLSGGVTITGALDLKKGALNLGSSQLHYGTDGTLKYSGTAAQTTSSIEFPETGGPANLSIANSSGVNLHASRIITGRVEVAGKLRLGDNDFTAGSASNTGSTRYVVINGTGSLRMSTGLADQFYPVGTASNYAPVWISNGGTSDTVEVRVEADEAALTEGGRVEAKWNLNELEPGSGNYTIKFGWLTTLENSKFRTNRTGNAYIFNLDDTTEAGNGEYIRQFTTQPYTVSRGGILELGTFGIGKFGVITDVAGSNTGGVKEYSLSQNYPNPFNPSTNFEFRIASSLDGGLVTLKIYDILGSEIAVLVNEEKPAGSYKVRFDASGLSSGVYYARLNAGGKSFVRKIMLLK